MPVNHEDIDLKAALFSLRAYIAGINQIDIAVGKAKTNDVLLNLSQKKADLIKRTLNKFADAKLVQRLKALSEDAERLKKLGIGRKDVLMLKNFFENGLPLMEEWLDVQKATTNAFSQGSLEGVFAAAQAQTKLQGKVPLLGVRRIGTIAATFLVALTMGCQTVGVKAGIEKTPQKSEAAITLEGCYAFPDLRVQQKGKEYVMIGRAKNGRNSRTVAEADARAKLLQFLGVNEATLSGFRPVRYAENEGYTYVLMKGPVSGVQK